MVGFEPAPLGNCLSALTTKPYVLIKLCRNSYILVTTYLCLLTHTDVYNIELPQDEVVAFLKDSQAIAYDGLAQSIKVNSPERFEGVNKDLSPQTNVRNYITIDTEMEVATGCADGG